MMGDFAYAVYVDSLGPVANHLPLINSASSGQINFIIYHKNKKMYSGFT